jgi:hypothetical protein
LLKLAARRSLNKIRQAAADQMLERNSQQLGKAAVGNAYFSIESQGEDGVIEVINEIAIIVLRTRNNFDQLIVLSFSSRLKRQLIGLIVG